MAVFHASGAENSLTSGDQGPDRHARSRRSGRSWARITPRIEIRANRHRRRMKTSARRTAPLQQARWKGHSGHRHQSPPFQVALNDPGGTDWPSRPFEFSARQLSTGKAAGRRCLFRSAECAFGALWASGRCMSAGSAEFVEMAGGTRGMRCSADGLPPHEGSFRAAATPVQVSITGAAADIWFAQYHGILLCRCQSPARSVRAWAVECPCSRSLSVITRPSGAQLFRNIWRRVNRPALGLATAKTVSLMTHKPSQIIDIQHQWHLTRLEIVPRGNSFHSRISSMNAAASHHHWFCTSQPSPGEAPGNGLEQPNLKQGHVARLS